MSYNEEGLIRVKRGGHASKKHPDDKEERVELQQQPTTPPVQIPEERPSSIILEETPLVFPCYTTGFADLERELAREEQSQLFGKIRNLINWSFVHDGSLNVPEITRQVENSVVDITERLYYALSAIKDNNWNEYEINAHTLNDLYEHLNYYLQEVHREYNEKMDRLFITDERFNSDEKKSKILEMAKKYQKPAGEANEKKLEFVLFANRAIRSLAVEHVMEEFINDIMPHARIVLNENGLNNDIVDLIMGIILTGFISRSERGQSASLRVYEQRMKSIFDDLLQELESAETLAEFRTNHSYGVFVSLSHDGIFSNLNDSRDPVFTSQRILDNLRTLIGQQSNRVEGAIARRSKEESDALCAQLEEHDEQLIGAEGLRAEINIILNGYEIDVVSPIVLGFGLNSEQYKNAIKERSALEQIVRDLNSQDKVIVQQAMNNAQQNKTVQQMLAEKKLILITPTCKPFKDFHDKKDDHDDSNGGHGGNDPKPGPSGEARSIESAEARSIVDIPEAGSGFVKAVDDLTGLIAEIKTSIAETAEAERVYRVSNGDCIESKEISFKGFWKWAKGSCKHSHKDYESYNLLSTQRNEKMEKFLEGIEYAVNFIDHLEKESPPSEIGVSSRKIKVLQEAKKLFEVINYAKDTNGRGEAIYAYQADDISKSYTKGKIEKLEDLLNKIDSVVDREVDNYSHLLEKESPSSEIGVSSRKIKVLQEAKKLLEVINYAKDTNGEGEAIYAYQADDISKSYTKGKIEKLEDLLNKMDSVIDREVDNYSHLHNSIIQKISHAAADIVTNTKKYHIAEADAAMKAGNLGDARKHAESAKKSIKYDFSPKGVQSYNEGDWKNITLESLQQYAREKLDIAKASSEELEFFMRVYEKIIDKYTQRLREEDASCKDLVLKIVTKSKLIDIKTNLDTALEELNGIETEKSNAQDIHDLLTRTLQEEHYLISRVSDYSFGKILPTLDAYSVIFGTEKNLLDSVNLSKLPSLSKHFSIDPEQLRADIDKTFADMKKVAGIDTQVNALKCGCIAMNNALTGDGQNAAQYLGESLKSHADRCVSGADKFLSAGFEPLLKDMHDKNFYRNKAPDFLLFNKLMCSIRNDNLHNEPHISAPQTVSLPDVAPIPAPRPPHDEVPPHGHDEF